VSDLLPYNVTPQERAASEAVARLGDVPVPIRDVWNADTCPPGQALATLAWAFSVDEWFSDWTDEQKREFIKSSVEVHRRKGTIGAVRSALAALGADARIQEWFGQTPNGEPYTYRLLLTVDQIGIDLALLESLLQVIERTKNLRSKMTKAELTVASVAGPFLAAVTLCGHEFALLYSAPLTVLNDTSICF
jgi:phage tail P2-like protein